MSDKNIFIVIINPTSGKNRKTHYYKDVLLTLEELGIQFETRYTSKPMHASIIAREKVEAGFRKLIGIGGDGTFNEIVRGVCSSSVKLQTVKFVFIPAGTGNDWHRTAFPNGFDLSAMDGILDDQNFFLQDIGVVTYLGKKEMQKDYFINVVGTGFDVFVAQNYMKNSKKSGPISYLLGTIKGLLSYRNAPLQLTTSGKIIHSKCFIAVAGMGKYFAGGMKILPAAVLNNERLEVTIVKNLSKFALIRLLPKIYSGKFINHSDVESFKCKALSIISENTNSIQVDGEIRGQLSVEIEILPSALCVFAPDMVSNKM